MKKLIIGIIAMTVTMFTTANAHTSLDAQQQKIVTIASFDGFYSILFDFAEQWNFQWMELF